jgi:hypothetical protein
VFLTKILGLGLRIKEVDCEKLVDRRRYNYESHRLKAVEFKKLSVGVLLA